MHQGEVWAAADNLRTAERGFRADCKVFCALEKLPIFTVVVPPPSSSFSSRPTTLSWTAALLPRVGGGDEEEKFPLCLLSAMVADG